MDLGRPDSVIPALNSMKSTKTPTYYHICHIRGADGNGRFAPPMSDISADGLVER